LIITAIFGTSQLYFEHQLMRSYSAESPEEENAEGE
jgi:hypothetical protein